MKKTNSPGYLMPIRRSKRSSVERRSQRSEKNGGTVRYSHHHFCASRQGWAWLHELSAWVILNEVKDLTLGA
jgi:hypothetical protein